MRTRQELVDTAEINGRDGARPSSGPGGRGWTSIAGQPAVAPVGRAKHCWASQQCHPTVHGSFGWRMWGRLFRAHGFVTVAERRPHGPLSGAGDATKGIPLLPGESAVPCSRLDIANALLDKPAVAPRDEEGTAGQASSGSRHTAPARIQVITVICIEITAAGVAVGLPRRREGGCKKVSWVDRRLAGARTPPEPCAPRSQCRARATGKEGLDSLWCREKSWKRCNRSTKGWLAEERGRGGLSHARGAAPALAATGRARRGRNWRHRTGGSGGLALASRPAARPAPAAAGSTLRPARRIPEG